jgi:hypothetical protein
MICLHLDSSRVDVSDLMKEEKNKSLMKEKKDICWP